MVNKPEQNPPDPSANDDDEAVWLDLVARLEATSSGLPETGRRSAFTDFDPLGVSRPSERDVQPSSSQPPAPTDPREGTEFEPGMLPGPRHRGPEGSSDFDRPGDFAGVENFGRAEDFEGLDIGGEDGSSRISGPRDYAADADDGEFVPEEPASLANVEPAIMLAWLGALGAPIGLLLAAMLWRDAPLTAIFGLVAVFLISAGYLIFRLPASRGDDDDDGAVV